MTHPLFMSAEHVGILNERLEHSLEARRLCSSQERDYVLLYVLHDNPQGRTEYWRTDIDRVHGLSFALAAADGTADVTISGDYWSILDAIMGKGAFPAPQGDMAAMAVIGKILASKEITACAVPVTYPVRSSAQ